MRITCPGCSTRYGLPPQLIGPAGARVSCPSCGLAFVVDVGGELAAVLGPPTGEMSEPRGRTNGAVTVDEAPPPPRFEKPPPIPPTEVPPPPSEVPPAPAEIPPAPAEVPPPVPAEVPSRPSAEAVTHSAVAVASILDSVRALDHPSGTLAAAAATGRLFADHGPALLDLFEALGRDRPGDVAADFRQALGEVTGIRWPCAE